MICSVLGMKGFGHTIELQRKTSECMFGTTILCMIYRRMGYSAAGVFTGSSLAQYARQLWCSFGCGRVSSILGSTNIDNSSLLTIHSNEIRNFTKGVEVKDPPPQIMIGAEVRAQLDSLVANAEGGFEGYGEQHAWRRSQACGGFPTWMIFFFLITLIWCTRKKYCWGTLGYNHGHSW